MGEAMKERRRYLVNRFMLCFILLAVLILVAAALAGTGSKRLEGAAFPVVLVILLIFLFAGYRLLWRPYRKLNDQFSRFAGGYISLQELSRTDVLLSAEMEQFLGQLESVVDATRNLDLSKRQAQYRALQNQINPHFLYNTLEGIRSEALIAGLDNLADMTEALATFFRYTISKVETLVTVEEELDNCFIYFKIQQFRFGNRIHLKVETDEEDRGSILTCRMPKLTLQPILENSIIHGIELKMGEGNITIEITRTQERLIVRVKDDGVGMDHQALEALNAKLDSKEEEYRESNSKEEGGIALVNVNNRIHLLFGEEYGMHVYSMENIGTTVELTIPAAQA